MGDRALDAVGLTLLGPATLRYGDALPLSDGGCRLHPELLRTLGACGRVPHRAIVGLVGALRYRLLHGLVTG